MAISPTKMVVLYIRTAGNDRRMSKPLRCFLSKSSVWVFCPTQEVRVKQ